MNRLRASLVAAALVTLFTHPSRAADPDLVWRTIDTPHFHIHFYAGEERIAERVAVVAERAHDKLTRLLGHVPERPTELVLSDDTDDANGSATVLPYGTVRLNVTAPDDRSELNDYDDWLTELVTHEYTHIIHLDTIHGIARVLNWVLGFGERGHLYSPNQTLPRFLIEGLAVFEESAESSGGRLRSSIYEMWLRTATLEDKFLRLDQVSANPIQFPRAAAAYLYGATFLRFIADRYGKGVLRRFSHEYGGTWVPGGLNRALRRIAGTTFSNLYPQFRAERRAHYQAQRERLRSAGGETPSLVLTRPREFAAHPTFTPNGSEVVWSDSDGYSRTQLRRIAVPPDPESPPDLDHRARPRTLYLVDGAGRATYAPDGKTLYYSAIDIWRTNYSYYDLYALDLATRERRRLTGGLRADEPDLSPDGKTLAFTMNEAGARSLALLPVAGGPPTRLLGNHDDLSQVYTPAWSPDGKRIAFSWWRDRGYRDIWIVDVATGHLERITADRALDLDPRFSPDGRYLYFSSDRSGIYNLYAVELATHLTFQVTSVIGGAFDVCISPDGRRAVYVGFQADGWRLEAIRLDPTRWRPAEGDQLPRPAPEPIPPIPERVSHPYRPSHTAWPHLVTPQSYPDAFGQVIGLQLGGGDVLGHHQWILDVGFSLARGDDIHLGAAYTYSRLYPQFSLGASRDLTRRGGLYIDGVQHPYVEDDYSASASVLLPVLRSFSAAADLAFSYNFAYLRNTGDVKIPLDPNLITPRIPETGALSTLGMTWSFSTVRRYTYSISAEEGRSLSAAVGLSLKAIGSRYDVYSASWRYREYIPLWWKNHVLALSYSGGISGGDIHRRGIFYLGGYGPQPDLLRSAFDFTRPGGAALRGYAYSSVYGDQYHTLNAEYRFPIYRIEHGYETLPAYLRVIHAAVFADYGNAFFGPFDIKQFKLGVGAELRLELLLGYYIPAALQLGYAHGFMTGGDNQVYFYLNNAF